MKATGGVIQERKTSASASTQGRSHQASSSLPQFSPPCLPTNYSLMASHPATHNSFFLDGLGNTALWGQASLVLTLVLSTSWGSSGKFVKTPFPHLQMDTIIAISKGWHEPTCSMQLKRCLVNFRCSIEGSFRYYYCYYYYYYCGCQYSPLQ